MIASQSRPPRPGERGVPAAPRVAVRQVRAEHAGAAVQRQRHVLDVDVIDAIRKTAQELDRIDALPVQMARIEREAELLAAVQRVQDHLGAVQVEGDLARDGPRRRT